MFKTIRTKLLALSLSGALLILLVGVLAGLMSGKQETSSSHDLGDMVTSLQASATYEAVRADVWQMLRAAKNSDVTGYADVVTKLNGQLKALGNGNTQKPVVGGETTRQAIAKARASVANFVTAAQEITLLPIDTLASSDAQWTAFEDAYKALKADQTLVNQSINAEIANRQAQDAARPAGNMLWMATISALLLFAAFAYYVYRSVVMPLQRLQQASAQIEAGAYDVRVNLRSKNELGVISQTFDKLLDDRSEAIGEAAKEKERLNNSVIGLFTAMGALAEKDLTVRAPVTEDIIGTLGDAINQLTDVTATVLHHVTKIAGVVEHASERMKQQSDVVNNMAKEEDVIVARLTANLETAMASIGEVAVFASDSNKAAGEATKSTESAMHTVQATLSGMNVIRETISEMEKRIKRLGERSQEISQIVNLINTISERTHVLSLNAAMQAAMAGDAGRGFAVVAEEVQRLAENSRQATGQIANLVQNIQVETNDTIATVNKTIDQVVKESELAHNAGERMRETHEATARLVKLVATIANSSSEQTRIAASLRTAADEITQFTAKTAEQLNAQNQSAASLVTASKKLMESVSVFKLPPTNT